MTTAAQRVRDLAQEDRPLVMGGVYDGLTTRLADQAGFEVLFMGGFSVAATMLGEPDFGYLTQTEMADAARRVCRLTTRPVLVDADTGYGNALNALRTVELYHAAGAAGLFLEDQVWPKRCGHLAGKEVVPRDEMVAKITAAVEARTDPDLLLIARTDAIAVEGFDAALARAEAYARAGADVLFVEAPTSVEQIEAVPHALAAPCLFNYAPGGRSPLLPFARLRALGYAIILLPVQTLFAAARAMQEYLRALREAGEPAGLDDRLMPFDEFNALLGVPDLLAREQRFREKPAAV
jgi:2-methylisocitrate lyase-like PEP mutase family enzyme